MNIEKKMYLMNNIKFTNTILHHLVEYPLMVVGVVKVVTV
jgi:hypothetical protein